MNPFEQEPKLNRRDTLKLTRTALLAWWLAACGLLPQPEDEKTERLEILNNIEKTEFTPGSELSTTIFPRKIMWEIAQVKTMQGTWMEGEDESDWTKHIDLMESAFDEMAKMGIKSGRLVVPSYEVSEDGQTFNWTRMDRAIKLMTDHGIKVELAVGPLATPYYPGIRLPKKLEDALKDELKATGKKEVTILGETDLDSTESGIAVDIRKFSQTYLKKLMERYGDKEYITKFYLGNEWPDPQEVEGVDIKDAVMKVSENFMEEAIDTMQERTKKPIVLNTNLPLSNPTEYEKKVGQIDRAWR